MTVIINVAKSTMYGSVALLLLNIVAIVFERKKKKSTIQVFNKEG